MTAICNPPRSAESALASSTILDFEDATYPDLLSDYAHHPLGIHHAQQPLRYSDFAYSRAQMLQDLGLDVHPVGHMYVTYLQVIQLGLQTVGQRRALDLSDPIEIAVARATAIKHEPGENTHPYFVEKYGRVIGDVPYGRKTPADRDTEGLIATDILSMDQRLPDWFLQRMLNLITHDETNSPASIFLEGGHTWGFYKTALTAGKVALGLLEQGQTDSRRFVAASALAGRVTPVIRPKLEQQIGHFPIFEQRLQQAARTDARIAAELN